MELVKKKGPITFTKLQKEATRKGIKAGNLKQILTVTERSTSQMAELQDKST